MITLYRLQSIGSEIVAHISWTDLLIQNLMKLGGDFEYVTHLKPYLIIIPNSFIDQNHTYFYIDLLLNAV